MRFLLVLLTSVASAQTLGQFRIVDFAARTPATVQAVDGTGIQLTTTAPHGRTTGDAVYVYPPISYAQDEALGTVYPAITRITNHGNRGRGYFVVTVVDDTHLTLSSNMYTGATGAIGNGTAAGDKIIPLTTYHLRKGPRLWLDGPVDRGAWDSGTAYKALEMVSRLGTSYLCVLANTNQQPPNATYWSVIDPTMVGPGTFTAAVRDTSGRASPTNFAYAKAQEYIASYWGMAHTYPYSYAGGFSNGALGALSAWVWLVTGATANYTQASYLHTEAEALASGSSACRDLPGTDYCGHRTDDVDNSRIQTFPWAAGLGVIYETLTSGQKAALADRLLNDLDVSHNGTDTGDCTNDGYIPSGLGQITWSNQVGTVAGGGLSALTDLQPGSVIFRIFPGTVSNFTIVGRVKSIDSDTQITFETGQGVQQVASVTTPATTTIQYEGNYWWYTHPFGYLGQKTCGVVWWMKHHASSPRMLPGQEQNYGSQYKNIVTVDDSPRQNKSVNALAAYASVALLLGHDDIRAVRLGEQAMNYYMTQTMAQEQKSRWTGTNGHGTQYGPDRVEISATVLALIMKNSLTVTPPGVLTGNYLNRLLDQYMYAVQLGTPLFVQPWTTGYPGFSGTGTSERLSTIGPPALMAMDLFPGHSTSPVFQDYLINRRGDYQNLSYEGGWSSMVFISYAFPFFNPAAPSTSASTLPLQRGLIETDVEECIAAGLYCRPDTGESIAFSQTGWTAADTQVAIRGVSTMPRTDDDNYGEAGSFTILQNNGASTRHLLGGNGLGDVGLGFEHSSSAGTNQGNLIVIHNGTKDLMNEGSGGGAYMFARVDRWAGDSLSGVADNSYAYARINYTPTVRQASSGYATASAVQKSYYTAQAQAQAVTREVLHLKSGSALPNYVISYDSVQVGTANQLRAYWHLQTGVRSVGPTTYRRNPSWVSTDFANKAATLTVPATSRLNLQTLTVSGATNGVILTSEDYAPPSGWTSQSVVVTAASWAAGVVTLTLSAGPPPAIGAGNSLPVGSTVVVSGVTPSGYNGTYTTTGYATGPIRVSYAVASDPGSWVSGGALVYPAWCSYPTTFNPEGTCAGNYKWNVAADGQWSAKWPSTYRVHSCASTDGTTCASVTDGEWLTVFQPSIDTAATMPTITQPTCTASGGNCTVVQIADASYPKVAAFARQGALVSQMAFTTTHSGTAQYVISGLAAGQYTAYLGATPIVSNVNVTAADTSMTWSSAAGTITVGPATPIPLLVASPGALPFTCAAGGANPANQTVAISATVVTLDNWLATKAAAWLTLSPASGNAAGNLTVAVSCAGLAAGTYTDTISVASSTASISNSPQAVTVTLTVTSAPLIALSPAFLPFTCVAGGSNPASKTVAISATGTTMDNWSASTSDAWISSLSPTSNTVASTLTVGVSCTGLNVGVYNGSVSVASTTVGIGNSPQAVAVTLNVTAASTLILTPASLTFICTALGANPDSQSLAVSAGGLTLSNWSASKLADWLTISPTSNTVASSMTVSASCVGLVSGNYSDTITVTSTDGVSNSPQTCAVYLTVNPAVSVTTSALADATWRTIYAGDSLAASGGTGPYTYAILEGELPNGMALSAAGAVTGTPCLDPSVACAAGIYTIGVAATDALGVVSPEKFVTLNVVGSGRSIGYGGAVKRGGK